ncbi:hypothetical protein EC9_03290 [Rosistilla ulvae]|uniref:Uncharacterized protein n=1 Tax=Rosistilla ulvae TaxID=1930277 RepID=A0A517LU73_9BACT|nr:hypothetical protein [Rosistilla ulvae]QDS86170.1 hypothetical protein EC9_03290 [Rosistilla ulvae]
MISRPPRHGQPTLHPDRPWRETWLTESELDFARQQDGNMQHLGRLIARRAYEVIRRSEAILTDEREGIRQTASEIREALE